MSSIATTANGFPRAEAATPHPWLRNARWDLSFILLSVVIALLPYSVYLLLGGGMFQNAAEKGTLAYEARLNVNLLIAILIGGPHMYATFTRTLMDPEFMRKRFWFVASSILVPISVFTFALYSYQSYVWLLTVFFALASVHALHQLVWLSEAYNRKSGHGASTLSRVIDYGVVLTSLYPIAVLKMVDGRFRIGPVALKYNDFIGGRYWISYLVFALFFVFAAAFVAKTIKEYREGKFNLPKTLLIGITATLMFLTPAWPNMDTAFQGVNAWHSFQYLALTWYANRLREQRTGRKLGFLHLLDNAWERANDSARTTGSNRGGWLRHAWMGILGTLRKVDGGTGWSTFYMLCLSMLPISGLLILFAGAFWPHAHGDLPGSDETYTYMGILSILLVHYLHDAVLFTDSESIVE